MSLTRLKNTLGKILDRDYKVTARTNGFPVDKHRGDDLTHFPIEEARLKSIFVFLPIACCAIVVYGWCLHYQVVCSLSFETLHRLMITALLGLLGHAAHPRYLSAALLFCKFSVRP